MAGSLVDDLVEANVADTGSCVTEHSDLGVHEGHILGRVGGNCGNQWPMMGYRDRDQRASLSI